MGPKSGTHEPTLAAGKNPLDVVATATK
jgi:hypothetical protein